MLGTFIDFSIITKAFTNKWQTKYKVKSAKVDCDLIERTIKINDIAFIWNLSSSRFVCWSWKNLHSQKEQFSETSYNKKPRQFVQRGLFNIIHLKADEFKYMHYKYKDERVDEFYRCLYVPIERNLIIDDPWERNFLGGG